jgi:hypothetical protein
MNRNVDTHNEELQPNKDEELEEAIPQVWSKRNY